jgi:drug/metabolite transporter (DMT)-like permease
LRGFVQNAHFSKKETFMHTLKPPRQNPLLAAGLILTASAFIAGTTVFAKALGQGHIGPEMHPFQISFGRFAFALLALMIVASIVRPKIHNPDWKLHIGRTTAGWASATLLFTAVTLIPLPDATAISFLNPVFAMILAIPFLGERVGKYRWQAAFIALTGAFILLRPSPASFQPAALFALAAAVVMGCELIMMKLLSRKEKPFQILIMSNSIGFVLSGTTAFFFWQAPNPLQWAAMAGIGFLMLLAQVCYVNAIRLSDASFIAPFAYATLIFATLYDYLFFGQIPDRVSVIGAVTICSGALMLAVRERKAMGH